MQKNDFVSSIAYIKAATRISAKKLANVQNFHIWPITCGMFRIHTEDLMLAWSASQKHCVTEAILYYVFIRQIIFSKT